MKSENFGGESKNKNAKPLYEQENFKEGYLETLKEEIEEREKLWKIATKEMIKIEEKKSISKETIEYIREVEQTFKSFFDVAMPSKKDKEEFIDKLNADGKSKDICEMIKAIVLDEMHIEDIILPTPEIPEEATKIKETMEKLVLLYWVFYKENESLKKNQRND